MHKRPFLPYAIVVLMLAVSACQIQLPDLTPAPQATATLPASGSLLFEDDFSDRSVGWDSRGVTEGMMDYDAGGYRMVINSAQSSFWSTPHHDLADVRLEVDEGKLGGPDENRVGLICRYSGNDFYFFVITHDGYYGVGHFAGDAATGGQMELIGQTEMQFSPLINRGTNVNHLRADCADDALTLYVNGEQITQVHDSRLTHGDIGLLAGSFSDPGVDVIFDNFVVIQP